MTEVFLSCAHAFEINTGRGVNATSCIENCETSAVGRALGMLGIGSTEAIASADEIVSALSQQPPAGKSVPKQTETHAYIAKIKAYEKELFEGGVSERGLTSWKETYIGHSDIYKFTKEELEKYGKYLGGLIKDKQTLKGK